MLKISPGIAVAVVVVLVAAGGIGYYLTSQPSGTQPTTSQTVSTQHLQDLRGAFSSHLAKISSRDIPATLTDYQDSAVVTWTGNTAGLGGVYSGVGNIRLLLASALSTSQKFNITAHGTQQFNSSSSQVVINSSLTFNGQSSILGKFEGQINSQTTYTNLGGTWSIHAENWNYLVFNATSKGGATTFPEWQKIGPVNPSLRSPDPVHNFVWDYGGFAVAVVLYAFIVTLAFLLVMRRSRAK